MALWETKVGLAPLDSFEGKGKEKREREGEITSPESNLPAGVVGIE